MPLDEMLATHNDRIEEKIFGVVVGLVQDLKDPLHQGRIRVNFPWRAEPTTHHTGGESTENDSVDSTWARMATMMAGPDRGSFFIPEVGDEVLVAFHHGDPERPYIIGALWNKSHKPPEQMDDDGKNNLRTIKSRSGHILTFDDNDEEKKEKIVLQSKYGHRVALDDEDSKEKISMETKGKHKVILDDSSGGEKISIETAKGHKALLDDTGGKIQIVDKTGSNSITFDSNQNSIAIKSQMKLSIDSKMIEIKSGGMMSIEAAGILTIKGAMVKIN